MVTIPEIVINVKYKGVIKSELHTISKSTDAAKIFRLLFNDGTISFNEEFIMICMNNAGKLLGYYKVSHGGINCTIVDVRIIATIALQCCATQIMVAHNHPSGSLKPSEDDKRITNKLKEGLATLDIKLIDHLIITDESYFSLGDEGLIY